MCGRTSQPEFPGGARLPERHALAPSDTSIALSGPAPRPRDIAALILALCSLLLGLVPWERFLPIQYDSTSSLFGSGTLFKLLVPVLGGVVLAILLSPCRRFSHA